MQLKPFEAGRYDDESIVIRNPENGMQELFAENEFEVVKFLKQNESQSLLALLLPNIGVAKKDHIVICLKVLSKLRRIQVADYFGITGRQPQGETQTIEVDRGERKLRFSGANVFASFCFTLAEKALGWMGPFVLFALALALAAYSFLFFPFDKVETAMQSDGFSYWKMLLTIYVVGCLALSIRALLQAAFLRGLGRRTEEHGFALFFPFVSLRAENRQVNLAGYNSRIQLAVMGLVAPMALSSAFTGLYMGDLIGLPLAYYGVSACLLITLVLACPFFSADLADMLHVIFLRQELKERIATGLREIFRTKGSLSREMLFGLVASFVWLLAWLDSLRSFWEMIALTVSTDLYSPDSFLIKTGAGLTMILLGSLLLMPVAVFTFSFIRDRFGSGKRKIVVRKDQLKDSLTFEQRMSALERIPLFASLNDQERLSLLNEMQPVFYRDGDYLVHQGEVGREFFVLVRGHCGAYFTDIQGKSYHLADLGEGDAFGEIALIDDVPRTASIRSDGGCVVLVLKKDGFDRFSQSLGSPDRVKVMIRLTSFFRRHPLFSKLGVRDQAQLIESLVFDAITAGEEIPSNEDKFYVIYSGKVRMDTGDDSADNVLEPDDCFGYSNGFNARYFAVEGTGLLHVKREEFHSLIWQKLVARPELFI